MKMETTILQTVNIPVALVFGYLFMKVLKLGFLGAVLCNFMVYFVFSNSLLFILWKKYKFQIAKINFKKV